MMIVALSVAAESGVGSVSRGRKNGVVVRMKGRVGAEDALDSEGGVVSTSW